MWNRVIFLIPIMLPYKYRKLNIIVHDSAVQSDINASIMVRCTLYNHEF